MYVWTVPLRDTVARPLKQSIDKKEMVGILTLTVFAEWTFEGPRMPWSNFLERPQRRARSRVENDPSGPVTNRERNHVMDTES